MRMFSMNEGEQWESGKYVQINDPSKIDYENYWTSGSSIKNTNNFFRAVITSYASSLANVLYT